MSPLTPSNSITPARAQNFSVSRLNYRKDIDNAKVSIDQINSKQAGATSSISRVIGANKTAVSANGLARGQASADDEKYNEEADEKRYEYVRRLAMAKRHKKELEEAKVLANAEKPGKYEVGIQTGVGFGRKFQAGLDRKFFRTTQKQSRASFKHLDKSDRKYFLDLVEEHAKKVRVGTGFGKKVRKSMKMRIERDRRKGTVSWEDAKDMKKFTDNLPH